jgi:hypothetical protein
LPSALLTDIRHLLSNCYHLIILSARASTFGGTSSFWIFDFRFWITTHRITRSALAKTFGEMLNPICFADLRLMTNFKLRRALNRHFGRLRALNILSTNVASGLAQIHANVNLPSLRMLSLKIQSDRSSFWFARQIIIISAHGVGTVS